MLLVFFFEDRQPPTISLVSTGTTYGFWVTIDVYSRMIAGFYLSLDAPNETSVGMCLAHAILPKELWLAKIGVSSKWPVSGFMDAIHTDHGKDFCGSMLKKACENYGIRHDDSVAKFWESGC